MSPVADYIVRKTPKMWKVVCFGAAGNRLPQFDKLATSEALARGLGREMVRSYLAAK